jgi:hypothetical protein
VKHAPGSSCFALSRGGIPIEADPVTLPAGPSTVEGHYISRADTRWFVSLLGIAGAVAGFVVSANGYFGHKRQVCLLNNQCIEERDRRKSLPAWPFSQQA